MAGRFDDGLRLVLAIAEALRDEFGVAIDAHPGGEGIEAGDVNRAFLVAVRTIIGFVATEGDDPAIILTHVLRLAALRRLTDLGVPPEQAEVLVCSEWKLGDRWLTYVALAPATVIDDLALLSSDGRMVDTSWLLVDPCLPPPLRFD